MRSVNLSLWIMKRVMKKHHSGSLLPKCAMIFHLVTLLHTWKHL